jgi:hypothetical protein
MVKVTVEVESITRGIWLIEDLLEWVDNHMKEVPEKYKKSALTMVEESTLTFCYKIDVTPLKAYPTLRLKLDEVD